MTTATMNGLAWAALVARWEPEGEQRESDLGPVMAYRLDEPTLEIVTHDLEAARWEDASEFLALAIDEMFEQSVFEQSSPKLRDLLTTPTVFDKEGTIEAQQLTIPEPSPSIPGAEVEASEDGRYVIASCERCQYMSSGPADAVVESMQMHVETHAKAPKPKVEPVTAKPVTTKPRCATHGVWAREDDGRCKRCDEPEPTHATEALVALAALIKSLDETRPLSHKERIEHKVPAQALAKVTLGIRGNGLLARRSAHELAQLTGLPQRDLAKLTSDEAHALVTKHGINAHWVPATEL